MADSSELGLKIRTDIPDDLLADIRRRLVSLLDFIRFPYVCKSWNWASRLNRMNPPAIRPQLPLLMLVSNESDNSFNQKRRLYNVVERRFQSKLELELELQSPSRNYQIASSDGYIVMIPAKLDFPVVLFSPFTKGTSYLPSLYKKSTFSKQLYLQKCALSGSPQETECVLTMISVGGKYGFTCFKSGESSWRNYSVGDPVMVMEDVVFFKDEFYFVSNDGSVMTFDADTEVVHFLPDTNTQYPRGGRAYLVNSSGDLLVVYRFEEQLLDESLTVGFAVEKFDHSRQRWRRVQHLGESSLFLGNSSSISVCSREFQCSPNSIYFVGESSRDCGIFYMDDQSIEFFKFSDVKKYPAPIWIEPIQG